MQMIRCTKHAASCSVLRAAAQRGMMRAGRRPRGTMRAWPQAAQASGAHRLGALPQCTLHACSTVLST